jgi:hypothetical protein
MLAEKTIKEFEHTGEKYKIVDLYGNVPNAKQSLCLKGDGKFFYHIKNIADAEKIIKKRNGGNLPINYVNEIIEIIREHGISFTENTAMSGTIYITLPNKKVIRISDHNENNKIIRGHIDAYIFTGFTKNEILEVLKKEL